MLTRIPLSKLVPHESMAVRFRMDRLDDSPHDPVVVRPITDTGLFLVCQGHNRIAKACENGRTDIEAAVAPPEFLTRNKMLASRRIHEHPSNPLECMGIVTTDIERQHAFFLDSQQFSQRPVLNLHRGTMVKLTVVVRYGDVTLRHKVLPMKGRFGGMILDPQRVAEDFNPGSISAHHLETAWGNVQEHDARVLPAYVLLCDNGIDCTGAGFFLNDSTLECERPKSVPFSGRPVVTSVEAIVLYPDGNVWQGVIDRAHCSRYILWSDSLIMMLKDRNEISSFYSTPYWWRTPTCMLMFSEKGDKGSGCSRIEHSCGSTCSGGGCEV